MSTTNNNTYNGWTNYETWNWMIWIDNDQGLQEYWNDQAKAVLTESDSFNDAVDTLSDHLKSDADEQLSETGLSYSPMADLLNASLSSINYYEIANSLIETAIDSIDEYDVPEWLQDQVVACN